MAEVSVSEAIWSISTRRRAPSEAAASQAGRNTGSSVRGAPDPDRGRELGDQLTFPCLRGGRAFPCHHIVRRDGLEQCALQPLGARDNEVDAYRVSLRQLLDPPAGCAGRVLGGDAEPADQLAGQVLQGGEGVRAAVEAFRPAVQCHQVVEHRSEFGDRGLPGAQ